METQKTSARAAVPVLLLCQAADQFGAIRVQGLFAGVQLPREEATAAIVRSGLVHG
jgi:hypothetical protein